MNSPRLPLSCPAAPGRSPLPGAPPIAPDTGEL